MTLAAFPAGEPAWADAGRRARRAVHAGDRVDHPHGAVGARRAAVAEDHGDRRGDATPRVGRDARGARGLHQAAGGPRDARVPRRRGAGPGHGEARARTRPRLRAAGRASSTGRARSRSCRRNWPASTRRRRASTQKLANARFVEHAPAAVVEEAARAGRAARRAAAEARRPRWRSWAREPRRPLDPGLYREIVRRALAEDLGWGDATTRARRAAEGARATGVLIGAGRDRAGRARRRPRGVPPARSRRGRRGLRGATATAAGRREPSPPSPGWRRRC